MSETITIREVDQQKTLSNVDKLKTKKQGGGYVYWVPEEDVQTTTKHITKNGTYKASSDGKYGYSEVTVNVSGGSGSADSHGKPTGGDIKPGGAGSAVVGTDPETGNDVVVGVDEDGNLVNTPLPSSIVLVTNPTKMDYNDGESIDLSGAVVVAKMADGSTWTDVDHPNGHVSCTPDPATADASAVSEETWTDGNGINAIRADCSQQEYIYGPRYPDSKMWICPLGDDGQGNVVALAKFSGPGVDYITKYTNEYGSTSMYYANESGSRQMHQAALTADGWRGAGTSGAYSGANGVFASGSWHFSAVPASTVDPAGKNINSLTPTGGTQTITLNWARPGDGKVLSTTMEINVGAHTTESSSGTIGSGGGGTF